MLLGGVLSSLAIYLSLVIIVRTWFANEADLASSGFLYQVFHPSSLPTLYETGKNGVETETSWWFLTVMSFFAGMFGIYKMSR